MIMMMRVFQQAHQSPVACLRWYNDDDDCDNYNDDCDNYNDDCDNYIDDCDNYNDDHDDDGAIF